MCQWGELVSCFLFPSRLPFLTQLQCCVLFTCALSSPKKYDTLRLHLDWDISHLCPNRSCVLSLFLFLCVCVLIGPGLPLPMDVAPPTTAPCIQPAAPRDCPRISLSLFPHSSSLVRRGRRKTVHRNDTKLKKQKKCSSNVKRG